MEQITMSRPAASLPQPVVIYCHECGEPMREVQRANHGAITYAWFECTRRNCPGVFLLRQCPVDSVPYEPVTPSAAAFA